MTACETNITCIAQVTLKFVNKALLVHNRWLSFSQRDLKLREAKPPIVNQQCLVYKFQCDLCDAGYVGFTRRHLHQRVEEHKNSSSSIGKHFRDKHSLAPKDLTKNFSVLMKCTNKFDCLVYEMFFIHELRPTLNVQSDSIRAKVFN